MEELIVVILQVIGEIVLEFFFEGVMDVASRVLAHVVSPPQRASRAAAIARYSFFGIVVGVLSLFTFPHPLVRPANVHGISLLISPLVVGGLMSLVGSAMRKREKRVVPIEDFWCGFAFAFAMAAVRLLFTK